VLVKRLEAQTQTAGGIIIPDSAKEKPQTGEIIAVGTGRVTTSGQTIAMNVKKGDKVLFGKYAGSEIEDDLIILKEDDILGVIEG
jgi:chaperonin GroES